MTAVWHPDATAEVVEAAQFYSQKVPNLGSEFLDEVDRAVEDVLQDPMRFAPVRDETRLYLLKRFPYGIYFRVQRDAVRILVVKHHSRHPDYGLDWR